MVKISKLKISLTNISYTKLKFEKFLDIVMSGSFEDDFPDNEVYSMAHRILERIKATDKNGKRVVDKFRFYLITNGINVSTQKTIESISIADEDEMIPVEHRVIDLQYIYDNYTDGGEGKKIEIKASMPFLEIDSTNEEYSSYLSVMSGPQIVDMYQEYGQQLLEQNVRTFLMFRPKVNKGLKETIESSPERFFAYNNGITGTAENVEIVDGKITTLNGFQIVNGGQTTSSIYACYKKDKLDVSGNIRTGNKIYIGENTNDETEKTIYFGGTYGDNNYGNCVIEKRIYIVSNFTGDIFT